MHNIKSSTNISSQAYKAVHEETNQILQQKEIVQLQSTELQENKQLEDLNVGEELERMAENSCPKMSVCSEEVYNLAGRRGTMECLETIADSLQTKIFVDEILKERPKSPPPVDKDVVTTKLEEKPKPSCAPVESQKAKPDTCEFPCETCPRRRSNVELKRPTEFERDIKARKGLENAVPQKWESQMVQALTTMSDSFSQIPTKNSRSAFAEALSIAPKEPFMPLTTTLEAVPLPEETEPYFPPEHSIITDKKPPKEEKPDSQFVRALQTAPDRPFTPVKTAGKKKKQPDPLFEDLPKPQEVMTMKAALTTASDRAYTPLVCDMFAVKQIEEPIAQIQQPQPVLKPKPVPIEDQPVPKPFKPVVIDSFVSIEDKDRPPSSSFPPITDELKAAYDHHMDYSQIKSEISSQIVEQTHKEVHFNEESLLRKEESSYVQEESLCQKCKCSMTKKNIEEKQEKIQQNVVEKQAECTVVKKPMNLVGCLHKPEGLPHYQLALDMAPIPMDFAKKKNNPHGNPHNPKPEGNPHPRDTPHNPRQQPLITVNPGDHNPGGAFRPVAEDRPPSSSFSPRPGSLTPSMINKPAPKIPYYQVNLVPTEHSAPEVNLFDPKSPAISRSPSPCPVTDRSPSPFRPNTPRPKSPAAGPPPNPLKNPQAMDVFKDTKEMKEAKKSVQTFIPQHKERMEQMYGAQVTLQSKSYDPPVIQHQEGTLQQVQQYEMQEQQQHLQQFQMQEQQQQLQQKLEVYKEQQLHKTEADKQEICVKGGMTTSIREKSQMEHLQEKQKAQSESIEKSADNSIQIQRKRTVTEEFEHTHKEKTIEIQKGATTSKTYAFQNTKDPIAEAPVPPLHIACPQPLAKSKLSDTKSVLANQGVVGMTVTCPKPIASPFLSGSGRSNSIPQVQSEMSKQDQSLPRGSVSSLKSSSAKDTMMQQNICEETCKKCTGICGGMQKSAPSSFLPQQKPSTSNPKPFVSNVTPNTSTRQSTIRPNVPVPNTGSGGGRQVASIGVAPRRGRGVLNVGGLVGSRIPLCGSCHQSIRYHQSAWI